MNTPLKQILPEEIHDAVYLLAEEGRKLQMQHKNLRAVKKFEEAYKLIPEPKNSWASAMVLLASIAENYFLDGNFSDAIKVYAQLMAFPEATTIVNYHLRIGQIRYEFGEFNKAKDEFMRVYMDDGEEGFKYVDPKYFELIRPIIKAAK